FSVVLSVVCVVCASSVGVAVAFFFSGFVVDSFDDAFVDAWADAFVDACVDAFVDAFVDAWADAFVDAFAATWAEAFVDAFVDSWADTAPAAKHRIALKRPAATPRRKSCAHARSRPPCMHANARRTEMVPLRERGPSDRSGLPQNPSHPPGIGMLVL